MAFQPHFQKEGPAGACVIDGQQLGWKNCTCLSFAMGIEKVTLGQVRISGCMVREEIVPRDTSGGTTIEQCAKVADLHGVQVGVHTGSNVASPSLLALSIQSGHAASLAGNTQPLGKGNVNHNVWLNQTSGGTGGHPKMAYVYDPWSEGPAWWAWSKVLSFAHALHPWGEADPRTLASMGIAGVYCGIFPREPSFISRYGGVPTSPLPDHLKGKAGSSEVARRLRPGPGTQYAPYPQNPLLHVGQEFVAYQWTTGSPVEGTTRWYGSRIGDYWISQAGITGEGGT
jgi:hypothetical protein